MHSRTILLAGVLAASCLTGACRETTPTSPSPQPDSPAAERGPAPPHPPAPPATGSCDSARAQWAIGERASADLLERARVAADAGSARFLRPGQAITMEYLGSRLNLGLDAQDVVRAVVCG